MKFHDSAGLGVCSIPTIYFDRYSIGMQRLNKPSNRTKMAIAYALKKSSSEKVSLLLSRGRKPEYWGIWQIAKQTLRSIIFIYMHALWRLTYKINKIAITYSCLLEKSYGIIFSSYSARRQYQVRRNRHKPLAATSAYHYAQPQGRELDDDATYECRAQHTNENFYKRVMGVRKSTISKPKNILSLCEPES